MSQAILNKARVLQKMARTFKDPENFLITAMFACKSAYDLAPALLAYKSVSKDFTLPQGQIWAKANDLVSVILKGSTPDIPVADKAGTQDYDVAGPSDKARAEQKAENERLGKEYIGPRHVGLKASERVHRFDTRWPKHW